MRILSILFLFTAAVHAQPEYFPLNLGSQWIYRSDGPFAASFMTVEVARYQEFGGNGYALVRGLRPEDTWLRRADNGALYEWDTQSRQERPYINFAAAENEMWPTRVDPCNSTGRIVSKNARYSGPIGEFNTALQISYQIAGCADAGLDSDLFLPYVGLIRRGSQTIAGPRFFDLIYARIGDVTVVGQKEVAFALSIDRSIYTANLMPPVDPRRATPVMTARITIRSTQTDPLKLTFPTTQMYEIVIRNDKGEQVYFWSKDKSFAQVITPVEIGPGEKNFVVAIPLTGDGTQPLSPGVYTIEAWLTTDVPRRYFAGTGFEVRHVF